MTKNKKLNTVLVLLAIVTTLFFAQKWIQSPATSTPTITQSFETDEGAVIEEGATQSTEKQPASESVASEKRHLNHQNESFSAQLNEAYANEEAIVKGRDFMALFYNIAQENAITEAQFLPYVEAGMAPQLVQSREFLTRDNITRQEKMTTYELIKTSPLTVRYTIIGEVKKAANASSQSEQGTSTTETKVYELMWDEKQEKIRSFAEIAE